MTQKLEGPFEQSWARVDDRKMPQNTVHNDKNTIASDVTGPILYQNQSYRRIVIMTLHHINIVRVSWVVGEIML